MDEAGEGVQELFAHVVAAFGQVACLVEEFGAYAQAGGSQVMDSFGLQG